MSTIDDSEIDDFKTALKEHKLYESEFKVEIKTQPTTPLEFVVKRTVVVTDLPLKFHPTAIRVSAGFAPVGAMSCSA
jgi:hypothetical protein